MQGARALVLLVGLTQIAALTAAPTAAPTASNTICSPYLVPGGYHTLPLCDPGSAEMRRAAPQLFGARFNTTAGPFTVSVNRSWAPHSADRFYNLVRLGFYNGVYFFRVIDNFVNEFGLAGDPGLQAHYCNDNTCPVDEPAAPIPSDPIVAGGPSNRRGTVAFSLQEGAVNGSTEIFINLADNSRLDPLGFTAFGVVSLREMNDSVDHLYSGYGELNQPDLCPNPKQKLCKGPTLDSILREGNAYLSREFPKMSYVQNAGILSDDDVVVIDEDL